VSSSTRSLSLTSSSMSCTTCSPGKTVLFQFKRRGRQTGHSYHSRLVLLIHLSPFFFFFFNESILIIFRLILTVCICVVTKLRNMISYSNPIQFLLFLIIFIHFPNGITISRVKCALSFCPKLQKQLQDTSHMVFLYQFSCTEMQLA
jgi:energy-coupling factor transporter transmembrane protein EcfT